MSQRQLASVLFAVLGGFIAITSVPQVVLSIGVLTADTGSLAAGDTQAVALSVLGCYFVIESISRLVGRGHIEWSTVTQLVLGVGLFFGARGVARLWATARAPGSSTSN